MRPLAVLASILILSLTCSCNDDDLPMEEVSLVTNEPISMCNTYDFYTPEGIGLISFAAEVNLDFRFGITLVQIYCTRVFKMVFS